MLSWLKRRRHDLRLADVDCVTLIVQYGAAAYFEARRRQEDAHNAESFAHWGCVAQLVAQKTGQVIGLDTATKAPTGAVFSESVQRKRILGDQEAVPSPPNRRLRR